MTEQDTVEISKQEYNHLKKTQKTAKYINGLILGGFLPVFVYSMILKPLNLGGLLSPYIFPLTLVGSLSGLGYVYYKRRQHSDSDEDR